MYRGRERVHGVQTRLSPLSLSNLKGDNWGVIEKSLVSKRFQFTERVSVSTTHRLNTHVSSLLYSCVHPSKDTLHWVSTEKEIRSSFGEELLTVLLNRTILSRR